MPSRCTTSPGHALTGCRHVHAQHGQYGRQQQQRACWRLTPATRTDAPDRLVHTQMQRALIAVPGQLPAGGWRAANKPSVGGSEVATPPANTPKNLPQLPCGKMLVFNTPGGCRALTITDPSGPVASAASTMA